jgi:hypothetical protein
MVWLTGVTIPLLLVRDADRLVELVELLPGIPFDA